MRKIFSAIAAVLLLPLLCFTLSAQDVGITLRMDNAPLVKVIDRVEQLSGYSFIYTNQVVDEHRVVSLDVRNADILTVLDKLFSDTDIRYRIEKKQIVLGKARTVTSSSGKNEFGSRLLKGVVTDSGTSLPLVGVTVYIKGTAVGTVTDDNGRYSLTVSDGSEVEYNCMGYVVESRTVATGVNEINVSLKENRQTLDETVIVGFATQKKINLTGAVGTIKSDAFESIPVQNAVQALQGKIPGLLVTENSGQLNSRAGIQVRGLATIGEGSYANTLVLIDGLEGDLYSINQQDIEDISVLKDAAASSIYGSRAPFGVILVTTKKGREGKSVVNYNNSFRFVSPLNLPEEMDSYSWATVFNDAARNSGYGPWIADETMVRIRKYMDGEIFYNTIPMTSNPTRWNSGYDQANDNVNYYDVFYKKVTHEQEHNVSMSGGNKWLSWYVSGNMLDQEGKMALGGDGMKRYNLAGKFDARVSPKASVSFISRYTRSDYHQPVVMTDGWFFQEIGRQSWPIGPLYDPNGFLYNDHALRMRDGGQSRNQNSIFSEQFKFTYTPVKGWNITGDFNYRNTTVFYNEYAWPVHQMAVDGIHAAGERYNNWTQESASRTDYYNVNVVTDYEVTIADAHYLKVMAGFQAEDNNYRSLYATKQGIVSPTTTSLDTATGFGMDGTPVPPSVGGGYSSYSTAGIFGRLNYNYRERYLLEVNARYDGSSRFRPKNRWGFFPSVSVGWNIANEKFMENVKCIVNMLKIRASYGSLGNQYTSSVYPTYAPIGYSYNSGTWLVNGNRTNLSWAPGLISDSLSWERITSGNIGLDWSFLGNRLTGSFDAFVRDTKDMVGPSEELPVILGTAVPVKNNTDLRTKGFELEIAWKDHIGKDFGYGVRFVLSDSQGKITTYSNPSGTLDKYYAGKKWGEIWGYETIGVARTQEEMDAHLESLPEGGQNSIGADWAAGDIMYADLNGDGKVDAGARTIKDHGDLKVIGNVTPRFNYGLDLSFDFKGIDCRIFLQGVGKRQYFQNSYYFWGAYRGGWWSMGNTVHKDYFRDDPENYLGLNVDSYYPRPLWGTFKNQETQSRYLQDASYLRLKNVQLGYTLPSKWTKVIGIDRLRVFASGENLLTFTKMSKMFDPETIGSSMGNSYPLSRTYSFGVSVTL